MGLKRDRSPSVNTNRVGDRKANAEKLERSRSGQLAQITILAKKFDTLKDDLAFFTEEGERSNALM